jgi:predicted PurR-regulated permease PerM
MRQQGQKLTRIALAAALFLLALWTVRAFLPALGWAVVIAIASWPAYRRYIARWRGDGRTAPALLATAAIAILVLIPFLLLAIEAMRDARTVADWVVIAQRDGVPMPAWLGNVPFVGQRLVRWWQETLEQPVIAGVHRFPSLDSSVILLHTRKIGGALIHRVITFLFTLLTLFFLYRDGEWLARQTLHAAERVIGPSGERLGMQMVRSIRGTLDGLVLVGLGEGAVLGVGYAIAGAPHAALLGALTAVAAMIPFGAPLLFLSVAALLAAQGAVIAAVSIAVVGFIVLFIADHFLRPIMIGGATKLPFLWVLLGILGGVETFGLLGLFLGPAIMAALVLLWQEVMPPREDTPSQAGSYRA